MSKLKLKVKFRSLVYGTREGNFSVFAGTRVSGDHVELNSYGNITISGDFFIEKRDFGSIFNVVLEKDEERWSQFPGSYKLVKMDYEIGDDPKEQWEFIMNLGILNQMQKLSLYNTYSQDEQIVSIILDDPDEIEELKGFGESSIGKLIDYLETRTNAGILSQHFGSVKGVGPATMKRILDYNLNVKSTIDNIYENPFWLLRIENIGFKTADAFREFLEIPLENYERCMYGVTHYINEHFNSTGDTYIELYKAIVIVSKSLDIDKEVLINHLRTTDRKSDFGLLVIGDKITTLELYKSERTIFLMSEELNSEINIVPDEVWEEKMKELDSEGYTFSDEQEKFLNSVNKYKYNVLIGQGGTGKSWITNVVCNVLESLDISVELLAPTAKAAKVMSKYSGRNSSTIHRSIYDYSSPSAPKVLRAFTDLVIIDEASMCDSKLFADVLEYVDNKRLIIIGDDFQLPSVGPGNVLFDTINHLNIPMTKLTKVYRFDEGIGAVTSKIRNGDFYIDEKLHQYNEGDITFFNIEESSQSQDIALGLYSELYKDNDLDDIMLLTPINKRVGGRFQLNKMIQSEVNPDIGQEELVVARDTENEVIFREGDYVTIKKNSYEFIRNSERMKAASGKEVKTHTILNGDVGEVTSIIDGGLSLIANIEGKDITFDKEDVVEYVEHSWSLTIHKSQGGQADNVIVLIPKSSLWQMNANMLYTAISRTGKKCTVVGPFSTINKSSKKFINFNRKTLLSEFE